MGTLSRYILPLGTSKLAFSYLSPPTLPQFLSIPWIGRWDGELPILNISYHLNISWNVRCVMGET